MHPQQVSKLAMYSIALMALTTIHHIYGAIIYDTPWRLHVLIISIPVIVLTFALRTFLRSGTGMGKTIVFWILMAITLIPSLTLIGVYEGLYNHVLKNIVFFTGASADTFQSMFPAPTYELPNDLIFEVTGILQGLIVIPMVLQLRTLIRSAGSAKRALR